ncbi:MAG TPA: GspH/FimT family pseudopilin [Gemmatimonadaceae bacterium]|nr:GspH/FimT family pseudopilin [Gemmatimonadaceae bacterium]
MTIHRQSGFTLLEGIIVMSILAVLSAIGAPTLSESLRKRATSGAADEFVAAHSLARATAVRYGRTAELLMHPSGKKVWIEVDTSATGINQRAIVWNTRKLDHKIGLEMSSNRTRLCFDARGLAKASATCEAGNAQVIFRMNDVADTVNTTVLGKVLR